jgi:hypothetical protein
VPVDGEIRIAVGKCLRIFAYFGLLFGVPAAGLLVMLDLRPPSTVYWLLAWCTAQAILGGLVFRSGTRARRRQRAAAINVAVERAIRLG